MDMKKVRKTYGVKKGSGENTTIKEVRKGARKQQSNSKAVSRKLSLSHSQQCPIFYNVNILRGVLNDWL